MGFQISRGGFVVTPRVGFRQVIRRIQQKSAYGKDDPGNKIDFGHVSNP
jgi:hypothetical protein